MQQTINLLDLETVSKITSWLLINSYSNTSATKGKTPQDAGYKKEDYQKIEIGFEEKFGSDTITIFFQRKVDGKGKSFYVDKIDDALYSLMLDFYFTKRENRKKVNSIDDILSFEPEKVKAIKKPGYSHLENDSDYHN